MTGFIGTVIGVTKAVSGQRRASRSVGCGCTGPLGSSTILATMALPW
jgi:hypothetical protein